ncbi:MAG: iron-sulfur cluster-binding domain-containing protein, partial [Chitinophagaceae bacterium]
LHIYPADEGIVLDIMHEMANASGNTLFYACGPREMLDDIETCSRLLGITKDRIQTEKCTYDNEAQDMPLVLELAYSNKLINVSADQPLLKAVRDAGVDADFDCCVGDCGSCAVKILEGEAEHRDHVLSDAQKADGFICLCVSRAKSDKLVLAL